MKKLSIDRLLLRRFGILLTVLFPHCPRKLFSTTGTLSIVVFFTSILDQVATYYCGILPSEFYVALGDRNLPAFQFLIVKSALLIFGKALVLAASKYFTSMFSLKCREICCKTLHKYYFTDFIYYRLNVNGDQFDNPDQRMTQDVEKLTRILTMDLYTPVTTAPFIIGYYTYLTYRSSGWVGPLAIYCYFIASTVVNKLLLSPIVALVNEQEKSEGNFRARHLEVRSNVEAVAFYRSGAVENAMSNAKLDALLKVQKKLIEWRTALCLATSIFDYYGGTLSYLLIAIPIFVTHDFDGLSGIDLSGIISKNVFFYLYLIYSFTRLVALAENFGDMAGVCHRVIGLYEEIRRLYNETLPKSGDDEKAPLKVKVVRNTSPETSPERKDGSKKLNDPEAVFENEEQISLLQKEQNVPESDRATSVDNDELVMTLKNVTITNPSDPQIALIRDLSIEIVRGRNLLISGDSSTGKTSVLRALAGLWDCTSGVIERHYDMQLSNMLFIPQNPYFPSGGTTLRQQLVYPAKADKGDTETRRLMEVLLSLKMDAVLHRFSGLDGNVEGDWNELLSRGELQRLALGRLLNHRPKIAFLDECTSAIGIDMQSSIYHRIKDEGIDYVSVGHRATLREFHNFELHLDGTGGWRLSEIVHN